MNQQKALSRRGFLACAGATAFAASGLAACSSSGGAKSSPYATANSAGDLSDLEAAAKQEGAVTAYIAMAQEPFVAWAKGFTQKYGISVAAQMQGDNALFDKWSQESRAHRDIADFVIFGGEDLLNQAKKSGWIASYTPTSDPKYQEGISKRTGEWYSMYTAVEPIVFNTSQMSPAEANRLLTDKFDALFDGSWVGRTSTVVPAASDRVYATYYRLVQQHGWGWMAKLAATKPNFQNTGTNAVNQIAAGQTAVLFAGGTDSLAARALASGAPVEFVYDNESTATVEFAAISANAPHPAAVRLFMEWATSDEALASMANLTTGTPAHVGIPDNRPAARESWYKPPAKLDESWSINAAELAAKKDFLAHWANVFNYSQ